jgi:zinc transporter 1/2/3
VRLKNLIIEMGKAFGTGVVITTGFIHMLMEAAHEFENECAPYVFHEYEGWAFAICIFTIFCVQVSGLAI